MLKSPNGTLFFSEVKHRVKSACSHFKTIKIKVSLFRCLLDTGELQKTAHVLRLELHSLCIQPVVLRDQSVFGGFAPSALYSIAFVWVIRELWQGPHRLAGVAEPLQVQKLPLNDPLATPMLRCNSCLINSFPLTILPAGAQGLRLLPQV